MLPTVTTMALTITTTTVRVDTMALRLVDLAITNHQKKKIPQIVENRMMKMKMLST